MTYSLPILRTVALALACLVPVTGSAALAQAAHTATPAIDPARTAQVGSVRVGQRQEDAAEIAGDFDNPYDRIGNRLANRVQNRLKTRIDPSYRPQTGPVDAFKTADDATKAISPRRR